jgi:hypothetical protein
MTNRPLCVLCGQPLADTAYVCTPCTDGVRRALLLVVTLAGEAEVTIARLDRLVRTGGRPEPVEDDPPLGPGQTPPQGALTATPLPVALWAGPRYDAAVTELLSTARHVAAESGRPLPTVRVTPCPHRSCEARRRGQAYGPVCGEQSPPEHPLRMLAAWLAERAQLNWLRYRPEGEELLRGITAACRQIESIVDRPVERVIVGRCPCGEYLYARAGAATVTCTGCGTHYDVAATRDRMRESLADSLFTGAEIATLATYLGYQGRREATRNRIKVWASRGLVTPHGEYAGAPAYRFGEVMARLMTAS